MFSKLYDKIKKYIKENYKFLLLILLLFFISFYELPFVVYRPGGIIDLENRIKLEEKYESKGSLSMAYVSMLKGNIPFVLLSYIIPNWDLVSKQEITLGEESIDDTIKRDRLYLENGLDYATISAYTLANKELDIEEINQVVIYITKEAKTDLQVGDILLEINNKTFFKLEDIQEYINSLQKNDQVTIKVKRDDKEIMCHATIYEIEGVLKIGISIIDKYNYKVDPSVKILTKDSESGSSGGLMTSLAIYNALVPNDITKGRKIVGTGTIDIDGNVGEIGGVKYKLLGAKKAHAEIFLCPKENEEEANKVKEENKLNIKIISVSNLKEAIEILEE